VEQFGGAEAGVMHHTGWSRRKGRTSIHATPRLHPNLVNIEHSENSPMRSLRLSERVLPVSVGQRFCAETQCAIRDSVKLTKPDPTNQRANFYGLGANPKTGDPS
jgi:hypothetical protein